MLSNLDTMVTRRWYARYSEICSSVSLRLLGASIRFLEHMVWLYCNLDRNCCAPHSSYYKASKPFRMTCFLRTSFVQNIKYVATPRSPRHHYCSAFQENQSGYIKNVLCLSSHFQISGQLTFCSVFFAHEESFSENLTQSCEASWAQLLLDLKYCLSNFKCIIDSYKLEKVSSK